MSVAQRPYRFGPRGARSGRLPVGSTAGRNQWPGRPAGGAGGPAWRGTGLGQARWARPRCAGRGDGGVQQGGERGMCGRGQEWRGTRARAMHGEGEASARGDGRDGGGGSGREQQQAVVAAERARGGGAE